MTWRISRSPDGIFRFEEDGLEGMKVSLHAGPPATYPAHVEDADGVTWGNEPVTIRSIAAIRIYDAIGVHRDEMWWTPDGGWVTVPYRPPRPWKVHTPGRFRQRRRRS